MVAQVLQRQTYEPGAGIFKDGDIGNTACVVQEGEVEIVKEIDGVEKIRGAVGQGGIFDEMALIDSRPRMATAPATKGTTAICVTRQIFNEKLKKSDPFIRSLSNILSDTVGSLSSK